MHPIRLHQGCRQHVSSTRRSPLAVRLHEGRLQLARLHERHHGPPAEFWAQAIHLGVAGDFGLRPLTSVSQQNFGLRHSPRSRSEPRAQAIHRESRGMSNSCRSPQSRSGFGLRPFTRITPSSGHSPRIRSGVLGSGHSPRSRSGIVASQATHLGVILLGAAAGLRAQATHLVLAATLSSAIRLGDAAEPRAQAIHCGVAADRPPRPKLARLKAATPRIGRLRPPRPELARLRPPRPELAEPGRHAPNWHV